MGCEHTDTARLPEMQDLTDLEFDRRCLNPVGFVSLLVHRSLNWIRKKRASSRWGGWRKLPLEHIHVMLLEVKGQMLSPAFDRGDVGAQEGHGDLSAIGVNWKQGHGQGCKAGCLVGGLPSPHP